MSRSFIPCLALLTLTLSVVLPTGPLLAQESKPTAIALGEGQAQFEWVDGFGRRPDGKKLGNTHGSIAVDQKGRIYFNTDTADAIMVFEKDGTFVRSFGKEWAGGLHGMIIKKEGDREVMYLAHTGRHEAAKTDLDGTVLVTFAWPEASGKYSEKGQFNPTSIAVAPNGEVFVADGYGRSWVHQYSAKGEWMQSFGGAGGEVGKMQTPHGLFVDTRTDPPMLVVSDRENNRLQLFDLNGKPQKEIKGDLRRPCNVDSFGDLLAVADLCGRVTIFDREWKVVAHLGDNPDKNQWAQNGVPSKDWKPGVFISPHSAKFDDEGNLYVMDWVSEGRVTKLRAKSK